MRACHSDWDPGFSYIPVHAWDRVYEMHFEALQVFPGGNKTPAWIHSIGRTKFRF